MQIAYVGNFTQPHCTEVHLANTLEKLGHSVNRIQEDPSNAPLMQRVAGSDLFLFTRTWNNLVTMDFLEELRQAGIPSASYHLDLYIGLQRQDGLDNDPFWKTDYVFQPDGDPQSMAVFKEKGINAHWLKPGVYEPDCYKAKAPLTRDVIFVGSKYYHPEWPYRPQLITWLRDTYGERFEHWGNDGLGTVRNHALNELYASTKVVVGDSLCLNGHQDYWSDRPYETLGRGGFLIMPFIPGLQNEFTIRPTRPGAAKLDMATYEYGDFGGLKKKIDYFLKHDKYREAIRRQGHRTVKRKYTYTTRLKQMLEIINGQN